MKAIQVDGDMKRGRTASCRSFGDKGSSPPLLVGDQTVKCLIPRDRLPIGPNRRPIGPQSIPNGPPNRSLIVPFPDCPLP